jgi:hypothetical protein
MPMWDVGLAGDDGVGLVVPDEINVVQLNCTTVGCGNCTCLQTAPTIAN